MHIKIFSHTDLDGHASAAIAALKHKDKVDIHLIDYGDPFPLDKIKKNDAVYLLDFCPNDPDIIEEILERAVWFKWIDHHVSSRNMVEKAYLQDLFAPPSEFITDSEQSPKAACELTYMHLYNVEYHDVPYHIRLLGRFDIWDHTDRQTVPFQYAMRAYLDPPTKNIQKWKKLIYPTKQDLTLLNKLIESGTYIKMYEDKKNAITSKLLCFEMEFEGYRTIAVNRVLESSLFFNEVYNPKKHDLMLQFAYTGNRWQLSFRSDKKDVDCSKIAEKYSGGGHRGASGCEVKELPNEIKEFVCK